METAVMLAVWALCGWACYQMAQSKNRNKELWAVLGVLFGIFAVIILSVLPNLPG
jgi:drug/metabolite transporter (DMT)-like permease